MSMRARNKFAAVLKMLKFTEILIKLARVDIFGQQIAKARCIGKIAAVKRQKLGITSCMPPAPDFSLTLPVCNAMPGCKALSMDDLPTPEGPANALILPFKYSFSASSPVPLKVDTVKQYSLPYGKLRQFLQAALHLQGLFY